MVDAKSLLRTIAFKHTINWNIKQLFNTSPIRSRFEFVCIGKNICRIKNAMKVENDIQYKRLTIKTNNCGVAVRDTVLGAQIKTKSQYFIKAGQLAVSKIDARNGAFGVVPEKADNAIITGNFWVYDVTISKANMQYLLLIFSSEKFIDAWQDCSNGSGNRLYLQENQFLQYKIPLPSLGEQNYLVKKYEDTIMQAETCETDAEHLEASIEEYLFNVLGITVKQPGNIVTSTFLRTVRFKEIMQWGYEKNATTFPYSFLKYPANSFLTTPKWCASLVRGKSPKYAENSTCSILNQKCNRWDEIDLTYVKTVDSVWIEKMDKELFTKTNDILINSTGEGTLGRASLIKKEQHIGLLFDSHMLLLRVNEDYVNQQLIVYIINSSFGQKQIELLKGAQATKQTELGVENMKKIIFPLPEKSVQNEIADHITKIKDQIRDLRQKAESLRSLAKKEFENAVFSE